MAVNVLLLLGCSIFVAFLIICHFVVFLVVLALCVFCYLASLFRVLRVLLRLSLCDGRPRALFLRLVTLTLELAEKDGKVEVAKTRIVP